MAKNFIVTVILLLICIGLSSCTSTKELNSNQEASPVQQGSTAQPPNNNGSGVQINNNADQQNTVNKTSKTPEDPTMTNSSNQPQSSSPPSNVNDQTTAISKSNNEPINAGDKKPIDKNHLPVKAYVFTNNSGCCDATRQLYEEHRNKIKQIENSYGKYVEFVWFDISSTDMNSQKEMYRIAKLFSIQKVPAFLVINANDNYLIKQVDGLDLDEIHKVFERLK